MREGQKNIVLIGMPGGGKSSVGALVAAGLGLDFCDIDCYIQANEQKSIAELFQQGEAYFRAIESSAVRAVSQRQATVIATGGGVVTRPENMLFLRQTGVIIYLERPLELILASCSMEGRPLLTGNSQKLYTLYAQRKHLYEQYSDYRVMNDKALEAAANQIIQSQCDSERKSLVFAGCRLEAVAE